MSRASGSSLADSDHIIAELRRQLDERTAERDEALVRLTATAELLGVINASPGDIAPVFDAMLDKAIRLCDARMGVLWSYADDRLTPRAVRGASTAYAAFLDKGEFSPEPPRHDDILQIADLQNSEPYRQGYPSV